VGTEELRAWAEANGKPLDDYPLALIATGDASDFGNDRSAMVFKVCCDLVRARNDSLDWARGFTPQGLPLETSGRRTTSPLDPEKEGGRP